MRYTGDATASNQQRMDFAGGVEMVASIYVMADSSPTMYPINQNFNRVATGVAPSVNVSTLPLNLMLEKNRMSLLVGLSDFLIVCAKS